MSEQARMQTVILCGGQGTRAYPHTQTIPKALMEIGSVPIVEQVMRIYAREGVREFILSVGYLKEAIEEWVAERRLPWDVACVDTGARTDTGGRIAGVQHLLRGRFHATYCDGLGDVDIGALTAFHRAHGGVATLTSVPLRSQYGIVEVDPDDLVTGFREKPMLPEHWINGGFFVFEAEVFSHWSGENLERDVLPALAREQQLFTYKHGGFWRSMDTYKDQQELNALWAPHAERLEAQTSNGALVHGGGA